MLYADLGYVAIICFHEKSEQGRIMVTPRDCGSARWSETGQASDKAGSFEQVDIEQTECDARDRIYLKSSMYTRNRWLIAGSNEASTR